MFTHDRKLLLSYSPTFSNLSMGQVPGTKVFDVRDSIVKSYST